MTTDSKERGLSAVVCAAAEAVTVRDLEMRVAPLLQRVFEAHAGGFAHHHGDGTVSIHGADVAIFDMPAYMRHFYRRDVVMQRARGLGLDVVATPRHLAASEVEGTPVFEEYYRPRDLVQMLGACLAGGREYPPPPGITGIAVFRGRGQPEFTEHDLRALERVRPALVAAARRIPELRRAEVASALLDDARDAPRLALDLRGRLLWTSPRAEEILLGRGKPPLALIDAAGRLAAVVGGRRAVEDASFAVVVSTSGGAEASASLHVGRLRGGEPYIAVELEEGLSPARASLLMARLGLTRAEASVLAILEGRTNREIAARLSISRWTVKSHLTAILQKLGAATRAEAARRARGIRP